MTDFYISHKSGDKTFLNDPLTNSLRAPVNWNQEKKKSTNWLLNIFPFFYFMLWVLKVMWNLHWLLWWFSWISGGFLLLKSIENQQLILFYCSFIIESFSNKMTLGGIINLLVHLIVCTLISTCQWHLGQMEIPIEISRVQIRKAPSPN